MQAEIIALCIAGLAVVYLRGLLSEFGVAMEGPTTIMEDNQSAIFVSESEMISRRARHIPRRYFKIRELLTGSGIEGPHVAITYIESSLNTSDAFTKALDEPTFIRHRGTMLKSRAGHDRGAGVG